MAARQLAPTYAITVVCAGSSLPTSLYGAYAREYALSPLALTALFAVYVAAVIPTMLVCGSLSDSWGRRRVAVCGLGLSALGSILFACAPGGEALYGARLLQGTAAGLITGAATAALADAAHGAERGPLPSGGPGPQPSPRGRAVGSAAALASLGISIGSAGGPMLSGLIAAVLPAPLIVPYLTHLGLLLPAVLLRWPAPAQACGARWRPRRPAIPHVVRRAFALASLTIVFSWSLLGLFLSLAPSLAERLGRTTSTAMGGGVVALMLVTSALAQMHAGRLAPVRAKVLGLCTMAAGLALLAGAVGARSLPLLVVAAVAAGAGQGTGFTGALAGLTAVTPAPIRGEVFSAAYVVGYFSLSVPVLGVGALAEQVGLLSAVAWFASLATVGALGAVPVVHLAGRATEGDGDRSRDGIGDGRSPAVSGVPPTYPPHNEEGRPAGTP
ncbi:MULTISPECIES: MFS transporter [Streptomyces violaceusniger group]|uniref:MFS transporter n=2 Tax=Streptomyces rhizosphaericus TaxID=114699 RepID=A0ABN1SCH5_9ACTN|nr:MULTISPECIES: MFS transporter [Streptomyces violaceusniger group]